MRELAKHPHRGLDFIFVSQSPAKQVDEFVHDLIERHIHVRRRFGPSPSANRHVTRQERENCEARRLFAVVRSRSWSSDSQRSALVLLSPFAGDSCGSLSRW